MTQTDFNDHAYLLIGGYGGIGTALARTLADAGASITIAGRDGEKAKALADEIGAHALDGLDATDADAVKSAVDAAAEHFEDCGIFTPYAAMCQALGCRYADFERALREAAERESKRYGRQVPADDQYFVMHRVPPRGEINASGDLVGFKPAVISFTLCDDIKERIERGEEV